MFWSAVIKFAIQLMVSIALALIAYAFSSKPKQPKPENARDMEMPTAEAGRPVPVVFGEGTIKSPNTLWYGKPATKTFEIDA